MHDTVTLVLAIVGALVSWTASVAGLVMWLTTKFRYLEKTVYREMDKHRREDDAQFRQQGTRIQRLELKTFGFTSNPPEGLPAPTLDD